MALKQFKIKTSTGLSGEIYIPGDKSLSHRALIFAALASGSTTITGFLPGEDNLATLNSLRDLGVEIDYSDCSTTVRVVGVGLQGLRAPNNSLNLGNSGTAIRLLTGLLAWQSFDTVLIGDKSLSGRPMRRIADPLQSMGAAIDLCNGSTAPIKISGKAKLVGIDYLMPQASAQVKSCLLLAGMGACSKVIVRESTISRDHTERMMQYLGLPIIKKPGVVELSPISQYKARPIDIVGDISSAAFFIVAATIVPNSDIVLKRVGVNPTRTGVINILQRMGAKIELLNIGVSNGGEPVADIRVKSASLSGVNITASDVPSAVDEMPVLMVAAACAAGRTVLDGAAELRVKESDRIQAVADGLLALGVEVCVHDDGMEVEGGVISGGIVNSHGDHRIAMAFAIAGAISSGDVIVEGTEMVATSFPNFVSLSQSIGINMQEDKV